MAKCDELYKAVVAGEYDRLLTELYGAENLEKNRTRYYELLQAWGAIYGRPRKAKVYSIPYSVLLAGDGADVAVPTDIDLVVVIDENQTNVSRVRGTNYLGEDLVDQFQHGPYTVERDFAVAVFRGVEEAFRHFGLRKPKGIPLFSMDIYMDGQTLPGYGLSDPAHMAIAVAKFINDYSFDGQLTEKQLSDIVQYALANYVRIDSYATDVYATLGGKAVTGDFTDADAPVINEIDVDMCGRSMFMVNVGATDVNIADEEVDPRLDTFMTKLGKDIEQLTEKEFYTILADMADVDKEASLFLMDYYTQENFAEIYAANAVDGMGSPSVEYTVEDEKEALAGAAIWRCKPNEKYRSVLCCVADEAKEAFTQAMTKLYGEEAVTAVGLANHGTKVVMG